MYRRVQEIRKKEVNVSLQIFSPGPVLEQKPSETPIFQQFCLTHEQVLGLLLLVGSLLNSEDHIVQYNLIVNPEFGTCRSTSGTPDKFEIGNHEFPKIEHDACRRCFVLVG